MQSLVSSFLLLLVASCLVHEASAAAVSSVADPAPPSFPCAYLEVTMKNQFADMSAVSFLCQEKQQQYTRMEQLAAEDASDAMTAADPYVVLLYMDVTKDQCFTSKEHGGERDCTRIACTDVAPVMPDDLQYAKSGDCTPGSWAESKQCDFFETPDETLVFAIVPEAEGGPGIAGWTIVGTDSRYIVTKFALDHEMWPVPPYCNAAE